MVLHEQVQMNVTGPIHHVLDTVYTTDAECKSNATPSLKIGVDWGPDDVPLLQSVRSLLKP